MSEKIILYHKDKSPKGSIVLRSDVETLMNNGWVTSPADFNKQEDVPVDNIQEDVSVDNKTEDVPVDETPAPRKKGKRSRG